MSREKGDFEGRKMTVPRFFLDFRKGVWYNGNKHRVHQEEKLL